MNFGRSWFRWTLIASLIIAAAICFAGYLNWAFSGSAALGLPSMSIQTKHAFHLASVFLYLFIALEIFSVIVLGLGSEGPDFDSAWLRYFARYGMALLL